MAAVLRPGIEGPTAAGIGRLGSAEVVTFLGRQEGVGTRRKLEPMARPPSDRTGEPDLIEFGIPVLDDRLPGAEIKFPATSGDLEAAMGAIEIPYDAHGHTVTLGDALDQVEQEEFESKRELLEALHPVFEAYRRRTSSGLLGAVRSVLPF